MRRHSVARSEGDVVADMVLALVTELVSWSKGPARTVIKGREPTGVTVAPELRPFVDKRSDRRKAS